MTTSTKPANQAAMVGKVPMSLVEQEMVELDSKNQSLKSLNDALENRLAPYLSKRHSGSEGETAQPDDTVSPHRAKLHQINEDYRDELDRLESLLHRIES